MNPRYPAVAERAGHRLVRWFRSATSASSLAGDSQRAANAAISRKGAAATSWPLTISSDVAPFWRAAVFFGGLNPGRRFACPHRTGRIGYPLGGGSARCSTSPQAKELFLVENSAGYANWYSVPAPENLDIHSESFLRSLLHRQFRLSLVCAAAFMAGLFGLPLANYFFPELMATRVFGFTLSWLILGVGFFPLVWVIGWVFIRRSLALEEREVARARPRPKAAVLASVGAEREAGA